MESLKCESLYVLGQTLDGLSSWHLVGLGAWVSLGGEIRETQIVDRFPIGPTTSQREAISRDISKCQKILETGAGDGRWRVGTLVKATMCPRRFYLVQSRYRRTFSMGESEK